jgi:hypothetical protein
MTTTTRRPQRRRRDSYPAVEAALDVWASVRERHRTILRLMGLNRDTSLARLEMR